MVQKRTHLQQNPAQDNNRKISKLGLKFKSLINPLAKLRNIFETELTVKIRQKMILGQKQDEHVK